MIEKWLRNWPNGHVVTLLGNGTFKQCNAIREFFEKLWLFKHLKCRYSFIGHRSKSSSSTRPSRSSPRPDSCVLRNVEKKHTACVFGFAKNTLLRNMFSETCSQKCGTETQPSHVSLNDYFIHVFWRHSRGKHTPLRQNTHFSNTRSQKCRKKNRVCLRKHALRTLPDSTASLRCAASLSFCTVGIPRWRRRSALKQRNVWRDRWLFQRLRLGRVDLNIRLASLAHVTKLSPPPRVRDCDEGT